ncbi:MAG TPA: histidine kinase [Quisquiliibacterium sp.]|nr:histidine kinase [Quisquiliibacterium sp.]HPA91334.1 histidine kinase [Quisquiliibacterium sp.]HQD83248.1 histidine kinase [Quisquiliibacterium sp.]
MIRPDAIAARARRSLFSAWTPAHEGPWWAPWLWTVLFNALLAVVLTLSLPYGQGYWRNFVTCQAIGLVIHGLFAGFGHALRLDMFSLPAGARLAYVVTVVLAGSWIGYALSTWIALGDLASVREHLGHAVWGLMIVPPLSALTTVVILASVNHLRRQQLNAERAETARVKAEHETTAARLQLLNAQIEPHFLYNTLAHVSALISRDPAAARGMLDSLIDYLRASSRNMAQPLVSFADELESVRGYLAVMQQRLGARLAQRFEIAPDLPEFRVPPASVQTLVENAIKHGVEPSTRGGTVTVRARVVPGGIRIEVADTGVGIGDGATGAAWPDTTAGTGLSNLRERLRLALGATCSVRLEATADETRAVLELPDAARVRAPQTA